MIADIETLLAECSKAHGHLCPGQVLGVRMSLLGCELIGIEDPKGGDRKKLIVFVEIDRCMSDAVGAVTGVRLGRRSLKFFDYGKAAATFYNLQEGEGVRLSILESARAYADAEFAHVPEKKERQMAAYLSAPAERLFKVERVLVNLSESDLPGSPRSREICASCGEGVNDRRFTRGEAGRILCRPCGAGGAYYRFAG
jgi:formylmethanofuran dehydrogenase subunit E